MDEDPPVDEEPPEGRSPWEEPSTGETPPPWEAEPPTGEVEQPEDEHGHSGRGHHDEEQEAGDEPPMTEGPAGGAETPADADAEPPAAADAPWHEPGQPSQDEAEDGVEHLWDDDHPTSEQLAFDEHAEPGAEPTAGEAEPAAGEAELEAGEVAAGLAPEGEEPDSDEPPWGTGPPPWERGGFWGDEDEEPEPEAPEGEATLDGGVAPLAAEDLETRRARQRAERRRAGHRRLFGLIAVLVILIVVVIVTTSGGGTTPPSAPTTSSPSAVAHAGKGPGYLQPSSVSSELTANILIADRNNDRLLSISPLGQIVDSIPEQSPGNASLSTTGHTAYVTQHVQSVVLAVHVDDKQLAYAYGKAGHSGSKADRLHDPETAQETATGDLVIADRNNCRLVFVDPNSRTHRPLQTWGAPGDCRHQLNGPPLRFGYPVSAFPYGNDIIVTESNPAWVDVLTRGGTLVSATQLPFGQPSDASEYAPGRIIVTDRTHPGKIVEFDFNAPTPTLVATWTYDTASGNGELDRPTQAIVLPGGDVLVADSGNDRLVVIDPTTKQIIWQYGHTHVYGRGAGYLHTPESVALVPRSRAPLAP